MLPVLLLAFSTGALAQNAIGVRVNQTMGVNFKFEDDNDVSKFSAGQFSADAFFLATLSPAVSEEGDEATSTNYFRMRIGYNRLFVKTTYDYEGPNYTSTDKISASQNSFTLAPGLFRGFALDNRFSIIAGAEAALTGIMKAQLKEEYSETDISTGETTTDTYSADFPGGFGIGVNGVLGIHYLLGDAFFLGSEINHGIGYTMVSGELDDDIGRGNITIGGFSVRPVTASIVIGVRL